MSQQFLMNFDPELVYIDNFQWYYKHLFNWEDFLFSKNKRIVYFGKNKDDPDFKVIVKKIKINNNYEHILKEIYFLVCCKKNSKFTQIVDMFLSDDNRYVFIILKFEGVSLKDLMNYKDFKYWEIKGFIKHVIFQIISGLNILHRTNLIHNDIKPSNILITGTGQTKICDLGSVDKASNTRLSTIYYSSPDALLKKTTDQKDDMWSIGVIMLELYKNFEKYFDFSSTNFNSLEQNQIEDQQLKAVLLKYKITINNQIIDIENNNNFNLIKEKIKNGDYNFNSQLNLDSIQGIDDPHAIELLNKLLEINPTNRFSAQQALNSNYFVGNLVNNENDIDYNEKDYALYLNNVKYPYTFLNNIKLIKQKFLGQVLFE
jgi:serine/threonine protein kinase